MRVRARQVEMRAMMVSSMKRIESFMQSLKGPERVSRFILLVDSVGVSVSARAPGDSLTATETATATGAAETVLVFLLFCVELLPE